MAANSNLIVDNKPVRQPALIHILPNCRIPGPASQPNLPHHDGKGWDRFSSEAHYDKHESIFDQSEPRAYVHIIATGMVCLHKNLSDGRRLVLGFALPGDFIGFSTGAVHGCSASAIGHVLTRRMTHGNLTKMLELRPSFAPDIQEALIRDLRVAHEQMMVLGRCTARERTAAFILNLNARCSLLNGAGNLVLLPMTRADIGDFLGLTIETVSRTLNAFAREHLLEILPDGVRILDRRRLQTAIAI